MNIKLSLLLLQLLACVYGSSRFRYNNRMVKHHKPEELKLREASDCTFNICEYVSSYPEDTVKNIVDKHKSFHSFLKGRVIEPAKNEISIFGRNGDKLESFCKTTDVLTVPRLMLDIDEVQRHVVNLKNYSQVLKYQTCNLEDEEECFGETILDMTTKCIQKFNNIKLVTVDENFEFLEYRTFRIPTTCVCSYMRKLS